ncbi:MAG: hypothetical protein WA755_17690 [Candidatus Acidiferrales bacterium]
MENNHVERRAGLLVFVVFVLGAMLGGVGTHFWEARAMGGHSGPPSHTEIMQQLNTQLSLTPDQEKQVDAIIEDVHGRLHTLYEQQRPQYDALRADGRTRIRALLTPEQQQKFDVFIHHLDEQRAKVDGPR